METGGIRIHGSKRQLHNSMPILTIITVVRNCGDTIERTIQSVINQDYPNIEYLIIDGASTDNTLNIIKTHENEIDFWISEPDRGIYDAMNKGITYTQGTYINFMNAGDVFCNNFVCTKITESIHTNTADIVLGNFIAINETNKIELLIKAKPISKIWQGMICSHQSIFIKKSILDCNHFNLKYKIAADYEQLLKLFIKKHIIAKVDFPISKISISGISYSNTRTILEDIKVIHSIKPYSYHILHFIPYLFLGAFKIVIGSNLTSRIRAFKWKYQINTK